MGRLGGHATASCVAIRAFTRTLWIILFIFGSSVEAQADATAATIKAARARLEALPWDSAMIESIERAKVFAIPKRQNQGYSVKCGFYALSHVLSHFDPHAPTGHALYEVALDNGWYWSEEGSSLGTHLANVARDKGYRASTGWGWRGASIKNLKDFLKKGYGVVLAIRDISDDGFPLYEDLFKVGGHFVALEGFVKIGGQEYLIIKDSRHAGREPSYVESKLQGSSLWPVSLFESAWSFNLYVAVKR